MGTAQKGPGFTSQVKFIATDAMKPGPWQEPVANYDAVVNLAGVITS